MKKVLVTCPPMLRQIDSFQEKFDDLGWQITAPEVLQTLSVAELEELVPQHDGWIIGDDPANAQVVKACQGKLRAAVKWGVGIDNVDRAAFAEAGIPITNTPGMFGKEVADIALGYVIGLARHTYEVHAGVTGNQWPKPAGISLAGKRCGLVGFGDIGSHVAKRLFACEMEVTVYDPFVDQERRAKFDQFTFRDWPDEIGNCQFIVLTCALTPDTHHMLDAALFAKLSPGTFIVNVSRGPLIDEAALVEALDSQIVAAAALEVFEEEPLPPNSALRNYPQNILGSHNASNTIDAVMRTSHLAIELLQQEFSD